MKKIKYNVSCKFKVTQIERIFTSSEIFVKLLWVGVINNN